MYQKKYRWNAAEKENGLNNKDRAKNSYNKGEINHTANSHNKNIINEESKV